MKHEKCIIKLDHEWLIFFWGEIDAEICGIFATVISAPFPLKLRS